jgi:hypothetical protein
MAEAQRGGERQVDINLKGDEGLNIQSGIHLALSYKPIVIDFAPSENRKPRRHKLVPLDASRAERASICLLMKMPPVSPIARVILSL